MSSVAQTRWVASLLVVLGVCLATTAARAQSRQPYVQRLAPTEATIVWRTSSSFTGAVCYGTSPSALTQRVTDSSSRRQHQARLTGLAPATTYYYAVTSGSCPSSTPTSSRITTAPPVGSRGPFRMWLVGDSGNGSSLQRRVRDAAINAAGGDFDLFVHVGDMAYDRGTDSEFTNNFYAIYEDVLRNTPVWPAIGNHEGLTSDSSSESGPYYEGYVLPRGGEAGGMPSGTEAYYSFDYANVHFVVLDSYESPRSTSGAMLRWMDQDLAATAQDWIVAFWHHPPYSKGSHDSDSESKLREMRENALPILEGHGVDLVLTGHSHIYERSHLLHEAYETPTTAAGNIVDSGDGRLDGDGPYDTTGPGALYIVAGHGAYASSRNGHHPVMAYTENSAGSVVIDVSGSQMTLRNIRHDGQETDQVTLVKGDGLSVLAPAGGESFLIGSRVDIRWSSVGDIVRVNIDFSMDNGATWTPIAVGTDNDGLHQWTAPGIPLETAMIRVTASTDPSISGQSGTFRLSNEVATTLIPFGDRWEYWDRPEAPAAGWEQGNGEWPSGLAQLGYGDGDEATVLRDENPNIPTVYFRRAVEVSGDVVNAEFEAVYDDALAVWVNGQMVFQQNIGTLDHGSYSASGSSDNARASGSIAATAFRPGTNIIAAIVKQDSSGSSDVSFDLRLTATTRLGTPPPITPCPTGLGDRWICVGQNRQSCTSGMVYDQFCELGCQPDAESGAVCIGAIDFDGDGFDDTLDCDDSSAQIYPGAPDFCGDGIDQSCSGSDCMVPGQIGGGPAVGDGGPTGAGGGFNDATQNPFDPPPTMASVSGGISGGCSCRSGEPSTNPTSTLALLGTVLFHLRRRRCLRSRA